MGSGAESKSSRRTDRRTAARVPRSSPVFFTSGRIEGQGRLADLSSTGARLEDATVVLRPGAPVTLTFELSQEGFRFEVRGRVARALRNGFAVEFHLDPDPSVEALMRWILARPGRLATTPPAEKKAPRKKKKKKAKVSSTPPAREEADPLSPSSVESRAAEPGETTLPDHGQVDLPESDGSVSLEVEPEAPQRSDTLHDAPVLRESRARDAAPAGRRVPDRPRPGRGPHRPDPAPRRPPQAERAPGGAEASSVRPSPPTQASATSERIVIRTGPAVTTPVSRSRRASRGPRESLPRDVAQVLHRLLEGPPDESLPAFVQAWIGVLILMNVAAVALATIEPLGALYATPLHWLRMFSLAFFVVEYVARLFACTEDSRYPGAVSGRVRWALGPVPLADLAAIAPVLVPGLGLDLRPLRALRLFPLFGGALPERWAAAGSRLTGVLRDRRPDLALLAIGMAILVIPTSTVVYMAEHGVQPDVFTNIPQAAWWVVVTLATVGDGYVSPVTPLGKAIGALVAVAGVGMLAVAAGILASGFVRRSAMDPSDCPRCGHDPVAEHDRDA